MLSHSDDFWQIRNSTKKEPERFELLEQAFYVRYPFCGKANGVKAPMFITLHLAESVM